jgi:hypothetical protein
VNQTLLRELEKKNNEEKRLLQQIMKELKRLPEGRLEICTAHKKYVQYYAVRQDNNRSVNKYIPKKRLRLAEQLAQKAYDNKLKEVLVKRNKALEHTLRVMKESDPAMVYEQESAERRKLITPLVPTDEMLIEQWYDEHRGGQNSMPMSTSYTTIKGEAVRSKSEKLIADTYCLAEIPYVYEPTIFLQNGRRRTPDFAVYSISRRRTLYHEHFGLMDDDEYRQSAILKMREYTRNGYIMGENIFYTFEGENTPIDQDELAALIKNYIL